MKKDLDLEYFLIKYLRERPIFLSLIRAKEAKLYQKYIPLKHPILDFGCSDGFFAKVTFNDEKIDVGLDLRESRIGEAKISDVYRKIVIYKGKKIPYSDNYFNSIVSNSVLEHVDDIQVVLKEIFRVLKSGGIFLTTVMAKPWEENLFGTKFLGDAYKNWMKKKQVHTNLLKKNQWDRKFSKVGFKKVSTIGHLTPESCAWIDFLHYVSTLSLISYKLFGKWVLWPGLVEYIYPIKFFTKIISGNIEEEKAGAIFYVLEK